MRLADTNILIYAVSNRDDDAPKRTRAAAILKEPDLALSVQVLQEFYYQATRLHGPAGLTHEQAIAFLRPLRTLPTQDVTPELFDRATEVERGAVPFDGAPSHLTPQVIQPTSYKSRNQSAATPYSTGCTVSGNPSGSGSFPDLPR